MESRRGSSGYEKLVEDKPPVSPSSRPFRLRFHRILSGGCVGKSDSEMMSPVSPTPRKKRNAFSFEEQNKYVVFTLKLCLDNKFANSVSNFQIIFHVVLENSYLYKKNEYLQVLIIVFKLFAICIYKRRN